MSNQVFVGLGNRLSAIIRYVLDVTVEYSSGNTEVTVNSASRVVNSYKMVNCLENVNYVRCNVLEDEAGNVYIKEVQVFVNGTDVTALSLVKISLENFTSETLSYNVTVTASDNGAVKVINTDTGEVY